MDTKIGILILNYLAYQDTIECIDSLLNQTFQNFEVIIVDNDSPNDSYEVLSDRYADSEIVTVYRTEKNLGFAKGNNFGLKIFKERGIVKVLVINGDTLFGDRYFLEKLVTIPYSKNIGMIGPEILSRDGKNQNPLKVKLKKKNDLLLQKIDLAFLELTLRINIYSILKKLAIHFSKGKTAEKNVVNEEKILDPNEDTLHGAAIFFTENYLNSYVGFYPETFLYFEEDFLAIICQRLGFKQLYAPTLSIYHKEDASSDLLYDNNSKKSYLFKIKHAKKNLILVKEIFSLSTPELKKRMRN
ncbi:glycosyltransferase [Enterococcus gallinarum]|uniref:glycosyltransferase n=1 Tax=Enterococcus gallinarum TaxID=1353 RepID=UPI000496C37E|nr:glycosyltransferase family 2 protein [Enterococcus gallinarum]